MFNLIPYTRNDNNLFRWFDEMEKSFWNDSFSRSTRQFRTDIVDQGDHYELNAELPGFSKDDIRIDVNHDRLTISAQRNESKEDTRDNYVHRERRFGSFSRCFDLSGVKSDDIHAAYQNGILTLQLPKREPQQLPPSRQIPIES